MAESPRFISAASDEAAYLLARHTLPLGIKSNSNDTPDVKAKRGTFTLLRLAGRDVFVTCFHVYEAFRQLEVQNSSARLVAYLTSCSRFTELNGFSLIDYENRSLDVAIFGGLESSIELPGMEFLDYESSYLADPVVGDQVCIVGYPGANVLLNTNTVEFGLMQLCFRVSSVSERQVILANEYRDRRFTDFVDPTRRSISLGGLSGSPAFVTRNNRPRFVGIVTDCSDREQTIMISRLGCLLPDGTLNHAAIPW
jgi:hypothetical protein